MLTTRKLARHPSPARRLLVFATSLAAALAFSGCATSGPTHAYLAGGPPEQPIIDRGPADTADVEVATQLNPVNELYGIAYDPFTDHLFLRVFPGNYIRVVDRPANRLKRTFLVPDLLSGRGDLAIRSKDRHLFFAHPSLPELLETTLYGVSVRTLPLDGLDTLPAGVAYDQTRDRLLILPADAPSRIRIHDLSGKHLETIPLDHDVRPVSLAYDSAAGEFYAPLRDQPAFGVFDAAGHLQRTLPFPQERPYHFIDVGPRSFLRLF